MISSDSLFDFCASQFSTTVLEQLRQMVAINSFTGNAKGVNRLGRLTAKFFEPLGFKAVYKAASRPDYGKHLVLKRRQVPGAPTIALVSHLDTVFTEEEEQQHRFAWRQEGSRIYGPGTNDIKGGTALLQLTLSAIRHAAPALFDQTNWVVLLNACEEALTADFGQLCRDHLPPETRACIVFECDGGAGRNLRLVTARKGRAIFRVSVSGRGAHAGADHHEGANAIVQLARAVNELDRLTDYNAGLTINIGRIHGGTVVNRVPHSAEAELEMRAFDPKVYETAKAAILAWNRTGDVRAANDGRHACRVTVELMQETGPWPQNPASDHLLLHWQEAAREVGYNVASEERGGLSDGNLLWDYIPTLDGAGPCGENSHCSEQNAEQGKEQEWADAASFAPKAVINALAILRLLSVDSR